MKPKEKKPETVYRLVNAETGAFVGSYSRAYCDEFDFESVEQARSANCHGLFRDKSAYRVVKYRVIYELIDDDVDPPTEEEILESERRRKEQLEIEEEVADMGNLDVYEKFAAYMRVSMRRGVERLVAESRPRLDSEDVVE